MTTQPQAPFDPRTETTLSRMIAIAAVAMIVCAIGPCVMGCATPRKVDIERRVGHRPRSPRSSG
jgi:hypothetical protein